MQTNLLIAYLILGVLNLINIRKVFYPQIYRQDIRESSFFHNPSIIYWNN